MFIPFETVTPLLGIKPTVKIRMSRPRLMNKDIQENILYDKENFERARTLNVSGKF